MNWNFVLVCPAEIRDIVRDAAASQGLGPNNVSSPLSADGSEPPTAYGCCAWASQAFKDNFDATFPQQLRDACIAISWREDGAGVGAAHYSEVIAAHNLKRVVEEV